MRHLTCKVFVYDNRGNPVRQKQGGCCLFVLNVNFSVGCFLGNFLALEIVQVQAELLD